MRGRRGGEGREERGEEERRGEERGGEGGEGRRGEGRGGEERKERDSKNRKLCKLLHGGQIYQQVSSSHHFINTPFASNECLLFHSTYIL